MTKQYPLFFVQGFKGKVLFNVPMSEYTSLSVGGPADVMAFPQDEADLRDILLFAASRRFPVFILGVGTNLLVRDGGIRGVVVNMSEGFKDISEIGDTRVQAGGGLKIKELLAWCVEKGFRGTEFTAGIPGTVGGAVAMNAGAYGHEMKDIVEGIDIITSKGQRGYLSVSDLRFGYRHAELPKNAVIVNVYLRLEKAEQQAIRDKIKEMRERRRHTASISLPNAGSVFKNPEGKGAGKLIEDAGLKGRCVGEAEISTVHANYIVNKGSASARDILALMAIIRDTVYGKTGIVLEPEIRVVGED
ncbi:MAG: UDP-N-acetylmuramate dehydrogenase [Deltaproteobacteria bacterium]|nr:UDP-N-acetylmuramate dehydrogenase [Deltaproteobacteria bacterium]